MKQASFFLSLLFLSFIYCKAQPKSVAGVYLHKDVKASLPDIQKMNKVFFEKILLLNPQLANKENLEQDRDAAFEAVRESDKKYANIQLPSKEDVSYDKLLKDKTSKLGKNSGYVMILKKLKTDLEKSNNFQDAINSIENVLQMPMKGFEEKQKVELQAALVSAKTTLAYFKKNVRLALLIEQKQTNISMVISSPIMKKTVCMVLCSVAGGLAGAGIGGALGHFPGACIGAAAGTLLGAAIGLHICD